MSMFFGYIDDYTEEQLLQMQKENLEEIRKEGERNIKDKNYRPKCYTRNEANALFKNKIKVKEIKK